MKRIIEFDETEFDELIQIIKLCQNPKRGFSSAGLAKIFDAYFNRNYRAETIFKNCGVAGKLLSMRDSYVQINEPVQMILFSDILQELELRGSLRKDKVQVSDFEGNLLWRELPNGTHIPRTTDVYFAI